MLNKQALLETFSKTTRQLQAWMQARTLKEQFIIILLGLVVIFFLWNLFLMRPLAIKHKELNQRLLGINTEITSTTEQISALSKKEASQELINKKKLLANQSQEVAQKLQKTVKNILDAPGFSKLMDTILKNSTNNIELVSLRTETPTPWSFDGATNVPEIKGLNRYPLQIELRGDYFSTLAYLQFLEQLPGYFYWDTLTYSVDKYPQGSVFIKFYVMGN